MLGVTTMASHHYLVVILRDDPGKRGACVGVFQLVIAGKASRDDLQVGSLARQY